MDWWEFLIVMIIVLPIMVLWLATIIDAIARPDLSGLAKVAWMLGIIFFPLFGSLIYVISRPSSLNRASGYENWGGSDPDRTPTSGARPYL